MKPGRGGKGGGGGGGGSRGKGLDCRTIWISMASGSIDIVPFQYRCLVTFKFSGRKAIFHRSAVNLSTGYFCLLFSGGQSVSGVLLSVVFRWSLCQWSSSLY